jgi:voltage-gated sodium channel
MFGNAFPELFGTLGNSFFTLFQIMTLENWSEIARQVMENYEYSYLYFVSYVLLTSFIVLNVFIAVIVNGMGEANDEEKKDRMCHDKTPSIDIELEKLRRQIDKIEFIVNRNNSKNDNESQ